MADNPARTSPLEAAARFWRGETPLDIAFWGWAVAGGLGVNIASSAAFMLLMMADQVVLAVILGYIVSVPFNIFICVGIWRCGENHKGSRRVAELVVGITIVGMILLSVT